MGAAVVPAIGVAARHDMPRQPGRQRCHLPCTPRHHLGGSQRFAALPHDGQQGALSENRRTSQAQRWEERYNSLRSFRVWLGDCRVPADGALWDTSLGNWVVRQRSERRRGLLREERARRLDELGFGWDVREATWEAYYEELRLFRRRKGHCRVPRDWRENPRLGAWVSEQRVARRKGVLSRERGERLESLGFVFQVHETAWETSVDELRLFKRRKGHCRVPRTWRENPKLGRFVSTCRSQWRCGELPPDRFEELDALGMSWHPQEEVWEERLGALAAAKVKLGTETASGLAAEDLKLSYWVARQAYLRKVGGLPEERARAVEAEGLDLGRSRHDEVWEERLAQLRDFKQEKGHCSPTYRQGSLGRWVSTQRRAHKAGSMRPDRREALDELGFDWSGQKKKG